MQMTHEIRFTEIQCEQEVANVEIINIIICI